MTTDLSDIYETSDPHLINSMTSNTALFRVIHYWQHNLLFPDNLQTVIVSVSLFWNWLRNSQVIYQSFVQIKQKVPALPAAFELTAESQLLMIDYTL